MQVHVGTTDEIDIVLYLAIVFLRMRGGFSVTTEADQHGLVYQRKSGHL
jgi:hypothetical protein